MGKLEEQVAEERKEEFMEKANVLNVRGDRTKVRNGVDTGLPTVTILVGEKVDMELLALKDMIPTMVADRKTGTMVQTDIVALKPTTWTAGKTEPSKKSIAEQRKLVSGVKIKHD